MDQMQIDGVILPIHGVPILILFPSNIRIVVNKKCDLIFLPLRNQCYLGLLRVSSAKEIALIISKGIWL